METLNEAIEKAEAEAYVIYASSQDPDMRYLTQFVTSDPLFYIQKRGKEGILIVPQMEIERVPAKRMINSDASKRGEINEIIVTNY